MSDKKHLISTIGVVSALSFSLSSMAADPADSNPFEAESLPAGFMASSANFGDEGSCGEGSCGEGDDKDEEGSCGEGSCGEGDSGDEKDEEGSCGEGTCGAA